MNNNVVVSGVNGVMSKEKVAEFVKPRDPLDPDLVFFINKQLTDVYKLPECNLFIGDPNIRNVSNNNNGVQRIIINKWFFETLVKFRSTNEINISEVLMLLINDGTTEDWFKIMVYIILPFMRKHNII